MKDPQDKLISKALKGEYKNVSKAMKGNYSKALDKKKVDWEEGRVYNGFEKEKFRARAAREAISKGRKPQP